MKRLNHAWKNARTATGYSIRLDGLFGGRLKIIGPMLVFFSAFRVFWSDSRDCAEVL